jgi:hypothetical protein
MFEIMLQYAVPSWFPRFTDWLFDYHFSMGFLTPKPQYSDLPARRFFVLELRLLGLLVCIHLRHTTHKAPPATN